jgi:hypothetical protein
MQSIWNSRRKSLHCFSKLEIYLAQRAFRSSKYTWPKELFEARKYRPQRPKAPRNQQTLPRLLSSSPSSPAKCPTAAVTRRSLATATVKRTATSTAIATGIATGIEIGTGIGIGIATETATAAATASGSAPGPAPRQQIGTAPTAATTTRTPTEAARPPPLPDAGRHKRRRDASPAAADHHHREDKKSTDPPAPPKDGGDPAAAVAAVGDGDVDAEELEMMKMMGIPVGFDSTKGKHVPDADVSGVRVVTKRQPRQYMNRRGGFNRPLPLERNR